MTEILKQQVERLEADVEELIAERDDARIDLSVACRYLRSDLTPLEAHFVQALRKKLARWEAEG